MKLERLPILIVYPHSRCDCRCAMCDIWRRTETAELAPEDVARWQADLQRLQVEEVVFSGGEPLMHSNLAALAEAFKATGASLTLLTTGQRLAEQADRVAAAFSSVIVSLDGPRKVHDQIRRVAGAYDSLSAGVGALRAIRPHMPVHARCTVQKSNHTALHDTAHAARKIGFQSISFLAVDVDSDAFDHHETEAARLQRRVGLTPDETGVLASEIERLIADRALAGFVRESPDKLRAIAARFRARLGLEPPQAPPCTAPWVSAVVETHGALRPCFFHEAVGDIRGAGLQAALNSDTAIRFRDELDVASNPICRHCVCSLNRPAAPA